MSAFSFRPNLESMDERIVPDAAPVDAPPRDDTPDQQAVTVDLTLEQIRDRLAEIKEEINQINIQIALTTAIIQDQRNQLTDPNLTPEQRAAIQEELDEALAVRDQLLEDLDLLTCETVYLTGLLDDMIGQQNADAEAI